MRSRVILRVVLIAMAAPISVFGGESDGSKRTVAQESLALLKQTASYPPPSGQRTEDKSDSRNEIIKMEPFMVAESRTQRDFTRMMQGASKKQKEEEFSPQKGGTLYRSDRMEAGLWKNNDLFEQDSKYTDKTPMLKIDLLRLKF